MIIDRRTGLFILMREGAPLILTLFLWDIVVVLTYMLAYRPWMDQPALPFSLIGSALVLFLNMRNTAAYARWWEARRLWGSIINNCRSFARQVASLLGGSVTLTRAMIAYGHALRESLLGVPVQGDAPYLEEALALRILNRRNRPNAILTEIGIEMHRLAKERGVHPAVYTEIDRILSDLSNAQGGLERIRNTPLAIQFSVLPKVIVSAFCLVLPLSMVQEMGWITPFGSALVGSLFLALDRIGQDLENPFTLHPHGLPMQAMAQTIEIDLLETLGDAAPQPLQPQNGILL